MQNTMLAHSAGQISIEGGVDVNKGHMVYIMKEKVSNILEKSIKPINPLYKFNIIYLYL